MQFDSIQHPFKALFLYIFCALSIIFAPLNKATAELRCQDTFSNPKIRWHSSGGNVAMDFRENLFHFTDWWKKSIVKENLSKDLLSVGIISADPNLTNYNDVPINGKRKLRFNDFDDSGRGPFIFDFVRFVVSAKALRLGIKTADLFEMYQAGLRNEKQEMPDFLKKILGDLSTKDEKKINEKYVDKHTSGDSFKFDKEITKLAKISSAPPEVQKIFKEDLSTMQDALKEALPEYKILDKAYRIKTSGGSKEQPRFWFLLKSEKENEKLIIEFKLMVEPAVELLQPQSDFQTRLRAINEVFWKNAEDPTYGIAISKNHNYSMRRRFKKLISFSETPSDKEKQNIREFLSYIAYHDVGRPVSRQASSANYIKAVQNNPDQFLAIVESVASEYIELVKKLRQQP